MTETKILCITALAKRVQIGSSGVYQKEAYQENYKKFDAISTAQPGEPKFINNFQLVDQLKRCVKRNSYILRKQERIQTESTEFYE